MANHHDQRTAHAHAVQIAKKIEGKQTQKKRHRAALASARIFWIFDISKPVDPEDLEKATRTVNTKSPKNVNVMQVTIFWKMRWRWKKFIGRILTEEGI